MLYRLPWWWFFHLIMYSLSLSSRIHLNYLGYLLRGEHLNIWIGARGVIISCKCRHWILMLNNLRALLISWPLSHCLFCLPYLQLASIISPTRLSRVILFLADYKPWGSVEGLCVLLLLHDVTIEILMWWLNHSRWLRWLHISSL